MKNRKKPSLVAKLDYVDWFKRQPKSVQYKIATTNYDSDSQIGRGRRLLLRAFEVINRRHKS